MTLGIITAILVLSILVEGIELLVVKIASGLTVDYLTNNRTDYFNIRNKLPILGLKVIYTFLAALLAGWLGSKITRYYQFLFSIILTILQGIAFLYAMLFSEFKNTLPKHLWLLLLTVVLVGINIGYMISRNTKTNTKIL
ncbi:MAG: hypothetical protein WBG48_14870 [Pricia sp.]